MVEGIGSGPVSGGNITERVLKWFGGEKKVETVSQPQELLQRELPKLQVVEPQLKSLELSPENKASLQLAISAARAELQKYLESHPEQAPKKPHERHHLLGLLTRGRDSHREAAKPQRQEIKLQTELLIQDSGYVEEIAKAFHEKAYQYYIDLVTNPVIKALMSQDGLEVEKFKVDDSPIDILSFTRQDKSGTFFNLRELKYEELTDDWKEVNRNSARHTSAIIETMYAQAPELFAPQPNTEAGRKAEFDLIFSIDTALYTVWSESNKKQEQAGVRKNPLFSGRTYENMLEISEGKPPSEGWPEFIRKYVDFIKLHAETYARALPILDENKNGTLDPAELEKILSDEKKWPAIQAAAKRQATDELFKDHMIMKRMLPVVLEKLRAGKTSD